MGEGCFQNMLHNIPIICMDKETGLFLGKLIGDVEEVDSGETSDCLGRFLHVRVNIDIIKPLQKVIL